MSLVRAERALCGEGCEDGRGTFSEAVGGAGKVVSAGVWRLWRKKRPRQHQGKVGRQPSGK